MWTGNFVAVQREMIRRTIREHLEKDLRLRAEGIKVLTLFFIDRVERYRSYDGEGRVVKGPYATIFEEFEGKHATTNAVSETGDVKYHLGATGKKPVASGGEVEIVLIPNPSHLEVVNPVLEGVARARQVLAGNGERLEAAVLPSPARIVEAALRTLKPSAASIRG